MDTILQKLNEQFIGPKKPIPGLLEVEQCLRMLRNILFPGYYPQDCIECTRDDLLRQLHQVLCQELTKAAEFTDKTIDACAVTDEVMETLPSLQRRLLADAEATFHGDPAALSIDEIITSYLPFQAIMIHRFAHLFYEMEVPLLPRMMSEYAHFRTGVDIHPGAQIGESFCIDHGTGTVIGETAVIGDHVKIYQGVTVGALSLAEGRALSSVKRHPTIRDHVTLYANCSVLGGKTVIGEHSVIGGGAFVTRSVAPYSKVLVESSTRQEPLNR